MKKGIAYLLLTTLIFISGLMLVSAQNPKSTTISFGKNYQLSIDLSTGLYTIKYGTHVLVDQANASFKVANLFYQTSDYQERELKKSKITDALGSGFKYELTSKKEGLPLMKQYFYCYPNQPFVVTELEIVGNNLESNYLSPLKTDQANLIGQQDLLTLFVPYDNDAFVRYENKKLTAKPSSSAEVGLVFNDSRKGLVIGSLNHTDWKTGVVAHKNTNNTASIEAFAGYTDEKVTRDAMAHGSLKGNRISSPKLFIGYFNDYRSGMEIYAKAGKKIEPPYIASWQKATPVGWNSWGVIADKLNYDKATGVVDFFEQEIPSFRNEDGTVFIDLDSFWDNMVNGGFSGDFSQLKKFVKYCNDRNLQPGVYWAPFTDWGYKSQGKRKAEGSDYTFDEMWTKTEKGYFDFDGARALDPTHPGTQKRIKYVIGKLKDCGFKMIKIDFLGHAAAESIEFYDPKVKTGMQAYQQGMEKLSDELDNSMLIYAAISPSLATARYAHVRRIACDAWKSIENTEYTLNSVSNGWWQTYLYDYIDADHLVFENESIGANKARLISGLVTGSVILGDDYSKSVDWQGQIKTWLENPELKAVFKDGKAFKPVDYNLGQSAAKLFIKTSTEGTYLAVFNYKKEAQEFNINAAALGLSDAKRYRLRELFTNETKLLKKATKLSFKAEGAYLFKME